LNSETEEANLNPGQKKILINNLKIKFAPVFGNILESTHSNYKSLKRYSLSKFFSFDISGKSLRQQHSLLSRQEKEHHQLSSQVKITFL
jgi:hypothetical protein